MGWKPHLLAKHTYKQLDDLMRVVEEMHPNPRNEKGHLIENGQMTIYLIDAKGRKKLDAITWAVYHKKCAAKRKPLRDNGFRT
ncbi:hypothetical protein NAD41_000909 [Salmonella enterica]|nr:hypothetical protein [Salmonella enterica]EKK6596293.1 hypothetical protein [Salmonella enterica]